MSVCEQRWREWLEEQDDQWAEAFAETFFGSRIKQKTSTIDASSPVASTCRLLDVQAAMNFDHRLRHHFPGPDLVMVNSYVGNTVHRSVQANTMTSIFEEAS